MIMIVISFALVKFYAFAILYVLIVMQIKLVVVDMFIKCSQSTRYSLRSTSTNNHFIPRPRCVYLKKSCSYRGAY